MTLANESRDTNVVEGLIITETGLPGVLFSMLDTETDSKLIKDIHDTLTSMLQILAADNLSQWLSLCKDVLTIASGNSSRVFLIQSSLKHFSDVTACFVTQNRVQSRKVTRRMRMTAPLIMNQPTRRVTTIRLNSTLMNPPSSGRPSPLDGRPESSQRNALDALSQPV